jgi:hypothetical protein
MRITIDIPDEIHARLKARAKEEGTTIMEIILQGVAMALQTGRVAPVRQEGRPRFPVIRSKQPESLGLGEEGVYGYIDFP